jgi:hypothetical protein
MMSPLSPPLLPVNEETAMLFDYPLCLEQLLLIHRPVDLSDEVEITDYRNPAKGGLADVHAGTYNGIWVSFHRLDCLFLR